MALDHGKEFAEQIFNAELDKWYGPVKANRGIEYFRVLEAHEPEEANFEEIERYLRNACYQLKAKKLQRKKIDALSKNYKIVQDN